MMASYSSQSIDHLGLVSGMCKEIGLSQIIAQATPAQDPDKHITYGRPVERLLGEEIKAAVVTKFGQNFIRNISNKATPMTPEQLKIRELEKRVKRLELEKRFKKGSLNTQAAFIVLSG